VIGPSGSRQVVADPGLVGVWMRRAARCGSMAPRSTNVVGRARAVIRLPAAGCDLFGGHRRAEHLPLRSPMAKSFAAAKEAGVHELIIKMRGG